jgi:hypothetical protein
VNFGAASSGTAGFSVSNGSAIFASTQGVSLYFEVPIVGWSSNTSMSSDTDTRVVAASAINSTGGTMSAGTNYYLGFSTSDFDTHGTMTVAAAHSTSSKGAWYYTIPVSGFYNISASVQYAAVTLSTVQYVILTVYKNNVAARQLQVIEGSGGSNYPTPSGSCVIKCNAGDYIEIVGLQNSSVSVGLVNTSTQNWVSVARVSGPEVVAATESVNGLYTDTSGAAIGTSAATYTYATKVRDTHNAYSSGTLTIPVSGMYQFNASLWSAGVTLTTAQVFQVGICKNGTQIAANQVYGNGGTTPAYNQTVSVLSPCVAGDLITVKPLSTVSTTGNTATGVNNFSWARVGN